METWAPCREQTRRAVWGATGAPPSNIVDRHVRSLRAKLGDSWREPRSIATVRQKGYRLLVPQAELVAAGAVA